MWQAVGYIGGGGVGLGMGMELSPAECGASPCHRDFSGDACKASGLCGRNGRYLRAHSLQFLSGFAESSLWPEIASKVLYAPTSPPPPHPF